MQAFASAAAVALVRVKPEVMTPDVGIVRWWGTRQYDQCSQLAAAGCLQSLMNPWRPKLPLLLPLLLPRTRRLALKANVTAILHLVLALKAGRPAWHMPCCAANSAGRPALRRHAQRWRRRSRTLQGEQRSRRCGTACS